MKYKHILRKIYWFLFHPKTLGVKCIVVNNGSVLMIKNSYGNRDKWMFPGGSVNKKEEPKQSAIREVFEEVGIKIRNLKEIGILYSTKEFKRDTVIIFSAESDTRDTILDQKEIATAEWFELNNLPEITEYSKDMLRMLKSGKED